MIDIDINISYQYWGNKGPENLNDLPTLSLQNWDKTTGFSLHMSISVYWFKSILIYQYTDISVVIL